MTDITTKYLGLDLKSPLVVSPSPLSEDLDQVKRMEDAGAGAIVMRSLFEEELVRHSLDLDKQLAAGAGVFGEALSYFPDLGKYNLGPEPYLEHLAKAKAAVDVPILGSLNGTSTGSWIAYAKQIEEAGAAALELNLYTIPTQIDVASADLEAGNVGLVRAVCESVSIPVAVKLSPFYSAIANIAQQFKDAGAKGLVLFNRFYQPDFDLDTLEASPRLTLSNSSELLLRLHWVGLLYGRVDVDLAITGGVHDGLDAIKAMMAGASVAMMTSALLKRGVGYLAEVNKQIDAWLTDKEYESLAQAQGSMSYKTVANPTAFERANYVRVLREYAIGG